MATLMRLDRPSQRQVIKALLKPHGFGFIQAVKKLMDEGTVGRSEQTMYLSTVTDRQTLDKTEQASFFREFCFKWSISM